MSGLALMMHSHARKLDHIVLAVRDLEAAGRFYGRLGFRMGARNRHPWGTENRLIQFDGSFIELITVGSKTSELPPHDTTRFSFGAFVREYLEEREGIAMLVLESGDAVAEADRFEKAGIGAFEPFSFERAGRRPDGNEAPVAFTLAFAVNANAPRAGFMACQHHFPGNFWHHSLQQHPNGSRSILSVEMAAPDPSIHTAFLSAFTEAPVAYNASGLFIELSNCCVRLVADEGANSVPAHRAISFEMLHIDAYIAHLDAKNIAVERIEHGVRIPADKAFGAELRFQRKVADR